MTMRTSPLSYAVLRKPAVAGPTPLHALPAAAYRAPLTVPAPSLIPISTAKTEFCAHCGKPFLLDGYYCRHCGLPRKQSGKKVELHEVDEDDIEIQAVELAEDNWWTFLTYKNSPTFLLSSWYRSAYSFYLVIVMVLGTLAYCLCGMRFIDAFFLAVSAGSMTGLSTTDFPSMSPSIHVVTLVLIILCSPMLLTIVPIVLRMRSFHLQNQFNKDDMLKYDEYKALKVIMSSVLIYWLSIQLLGWFLLWVLLPYPLPEGATYSTSWWPALFLAMSAFHNAGLNIVPKIAYAGEGEEQGLGVLVVLMALILTGNTWFPICLRIVLSFLNWLVTDGGSLDRTLDLLLKAPRRCYTHLFPAKVTIWLSLVAVALILAQVLVYLITDFWLDQPEQIVEGLTVVERIFAVVFHSISTRTAGFAVLDLSRLSASAAWLSCVCMWLSTCPAVVAMRYTQRQTSEGVEIEPEYDLGGDHLKEKRPSGKLSVDNKRQDIEKRESLSSQIQNFLTFSSGIVLLLFFVIVISEEKALEEQLKLADTSDAAEPNVFRMRLPFLELLFETASSFGTVGLSMSSKAYSLSGDLTVLSQLSIIVIMFMGRLRGLPESIDPSVHITINRFFVKEEEEQYEDGDGDDSP